MPAVNPSLRREQSALETRRSVLRAAHDLFLERGYAGTSITDIATRAGVSRPTVFATGSKSELLKAVRDVALAGDDEPQPVSARHGWQRIVAETDPRRMLALFAAHVTRVAERYGALDEVLRGAASVEPELARLWKVGEAERREGARQLVEALRSRTALRTSRAAAVDVTWLLMAPDHHRRLVAERGWSADRYRRWLADVLAGQLLPDVR